MNCASGMPCIPVELYLAARHMAYFVVHGPYPRGRREGVDDLTLQSCTVGDVGCLVDLLCHQIFTVCMYMVLPCRQVWQRCCDAVLRLLSTGVAAASGCHCHTLRLTLDGPSQTCVTRL
eukprot:GHUV01014448.1.p2 GENE.GHUV01014448.1~~GHUV01014448.1.p2  ORF type:complete len:119 (+),score=9.15 GHUV01014448.1:2431-2787(+)